MIDGITNEILIASGILHTNNVTRIAQEIGYRPILIMNALFHGQELGKLTYNKKKDIVTISPDVEVSSLGVSEGMQELVEQLDMLIGYLNADEVDMTIQELQMLLGGTPELHIQIAVQVSKVLTSYEIADPKDKKSVYTFITLKQNADKYWGQKQFSVKKSKVTKRLKEVKADIKD